MNLVSIILPSYNGERCLRNAIRSIINQTYQNWELIIVNDCSTDNTLKIAQEFAKQDLRIKIVSNKQNLKLPASLNIGFKLAQGQYYTWTSDDNSFKPEALSTMVKYLTEHRDIDMVCCNYDRIDEDGKNIPKYIIKNEKDIIKFIKGENIGACFLYTKEIAQKVGEYDTAMFCVEDYDYWCRIALAGKIQYLNKNLYKSVIQQYLSNKTIAMQKKILDTVVGLELNYQIVRYILNKVVVYKDQVEIVLNKNILLEALELLACGERVMIDYEDDDFITITKQVQLVAVPKRGNKLIIENESQYNLTLIQSIAKGFYYHKLWLEGKLAKEQKSSYIYRLMSLRYLPPTLIEDILNGKQAPDMTVKELYRIAGRSV